MASCVPVQAAATAANTEEVCANCGKEGSDEVKLKNCTACFLVKYCGVDCQKIHRKQHKKACKERAAELKDEKLYSHGHERAEGDFCPLCLLAIPFPLKVHSSYNACCTKTICKGCYLATERRALSDICSFCRTPISKTSEEALGRIQKRVAAKDPEAISELGVVHFYGALGLEKDATRAFNLWSEAAELGSITALFKISMAYYRGEGVAQDKAKAIRCWESAAMRGCAESRTMLGCVELENWNFDRAVRHFMISAKMGFKKALDGIKEIF
ncbi:hypothetical protein THAOC_18637, partial [Thalassiosira oceanica]